MSGKGANVQENRKSSKTPAPPIPQPARTSGYLCTASPCTLRGSWCVPKARSSVATSAEPGMANLRLQSGAGAVGCADSSLLEGTDLEEPALNPLEPPGSPTHVKGPVTSVLCVWLTGAGLMLYYIHILRVVKNEASEVTSENILKSWHKIKASVCL